MSDPSEIIKQLEGKLAEQEQEHRQAEHLQDALYEIADAASAVTDMQPFYARLHAIIGTLMYARNFFIALYDAESGMITWPYHVDERDTEVWEPIPLAQNKGSTQYAIRTGNTLHARSQLPALLEAGEFELIGTRPVDATSVPLASEGTTIGALCAQRYEADKLYSEQDVQVLTFVAQHIATALT